MVDSTGPGLMQPTDPVGQVLSQKASSACAIANTVCQFLCDFNCFQQSRISINGCLVHSVAALQCSGFYLGSSSGLQAM